MTSRIAALSAYVISIIAGVWAIAAFGIVPIGFGFEAPAAVYVVGITLVLRDIVHDLCGVRVALLAVVVGAAVSALVNPQLALASGLSFLLSETLDLAIYQRIRRSGRLRGMLASNAVSIPVDSLCFLMLAFGSLTFFPGQVLGKALATLFAVALIAAARVAFPRVAHVA